MKTGTMGTMCRAYAAVDLFQDNRYPSGVPACEVSR
jgi:hypothetical protein